MKTLLAQMVEIDLTPVTAPKRKFVYLLMRGDEVVYVGQTANLHQRMICHTTGAEYANGKMMCEAKTFDRAFSIEVLLDDADAVEGALIRHFSPCYCRNAPANRERDAEILATFGIAVDANHGKAFDAQRLAYSKRARWDRILIKGFV